ncbi:MAG: methionine synthase [Bacteroidaceae bacterium]|nr:methionine synthase [Bacteroidaceae bacterium]
MTLSEAVKERVLLLDGATGTMIQQYGYKGNNDLLSVDHPEIVSDIHTRYLSAGADIIETCTFNSQRISMADYGCAERIREINLAAVAIARRCADAFTASTPQRPRFVAGSVGPTGKTLSMSPDVSDPALRTISFDELAEAYVEQMEALIEGGVDALLIETIFDTLNAKAALFAAQKAMASTGRKVPVILSVTISDNAGRTLSGQTLDAFLASISTYEVFSVGLNCSFGAEQMKPYLQELSSHAPYYISCYPNAGLPNELGTYDTTPEEWASLVSTYVEEGLVNIVGGCCGTTDAFIRALAERLPSRRPTRSIPSASQALLLSGLEPFTVGGSHLPDSYATAFTVVGERCNVAGSRKFLRLISEHNYSEAVTIARRQVEAGAQVIDINMDDGLLDAPNEMSHFLRLLAAEPDVARIPFMIDSSDWNVIRSALKCIQGKPIVNSISLKEGETVFLQHARELRQLGAAVVVMAFDEQGQATTYERRIEVCQRAYSLLTEKAGINPSDIIFDPNILAVATGIEEHDGYALDFIRATMWIRTHLPGAHVSGGVSNLSFAFRGNNYIREAMHAVFLHHAVAAGMDMAIVNPSASVAFGDIPEEQRQVIEDVILCRTPHASERLAALAAEVASQQQGKEPSAQSAEKALSVAERLQQALIKGDSSQLPNDLMEALSQYPSPVAIIEGPLMEGMNIVGKRFGEGQMFLPQVVKTARTMKEAVAILQPYIDARPLRHAVGCTCAECQQQIAEKPLVLLATVKGDVHDIGKNIVSVVMACNGYRIVDLGVMVPAEEIVAKAKELHPDVIGLSGLITPSLSEMVTVAKELQQAGLHIPLMIGGATTSELHTALRIAPVYDAPVVHVRDASQNSRIAAEMLRPSSREAFVAALRERQAKQRAEYESKHEELLSLDEARKRHLKLFD